MLKGTIQGAEGKKYSTRAAKQTGKLGIVLLKAAATIFAGPVKAMVQSEASKAQSTFFASNSTLSGGIYFKLWVRKYFGNVFPRTDHAGPTQAAGWIVHLSGLSCLEAKLEPPMLNQNTPKSLAGSSSRDHRAPSQTESKKIGA
ncbi:UNVERIFIED_CONTAM: hypothetical protein Sradi_7140300 [Sesamum radiatum]|uniref:Uncharacterized protein n=1 Tax=Sesamum radiatum TaxID=300843 RepID=A0AAW2IXX1_SESRA